MQTAPLSQALYLLSVQQIALSAGGRRLPAYLTRDALIGEEEELQRPSSVPGSKIAGGKKLAYAMHWPAAQPFY